MCLIAGLIAAFLAWCGKILRISFIIGFLGLCWLAIKAWEAWDMIGDYIILTFQLDWKNGCFLCILFCGFHNYNELYPNNYAQRWSTTSPSKI